MTSPQSSNVARALVSVSDKAGLVELGRFLADLGVEILSTGGSAAALTLAGIPVKEVSTHTGFPELMDGRVKTLHPLIHGGILGQRGKPDHVAAMEQHAIAPIDLVVVNLYPFEATVAGGADFETCIETIDIGGPALIRAAAKNHESVTVATDPGDYAVIIEAMRDNDGATTAALRKQLAAAAYARTASYDAAVSAWFAGQTGETFPGQYTLAGARVSCPIEGGFLVRVFAIAHDLRACAGQRVLSGKSFAGLTRETFPGSQRSALA